MAPLKQTDFANGTIVEDEFLDRIQEVNAPLAWNMRAQASGTSVLVAGAPEEGIAAIVIEGKMRYNEANATVNMTGKPAGTYGIWAVTTADDNVPTFTLSANTPATTRPVGAAFARRIATVVWSGTAITSIVQIAGYTTHGHMHVAGADPLPNGSVAPAMLGEIPYWKSTAFSVNVPHGNYFNVNPPGSVTRGGFVVNTVDPQDINVPIDGAYSFGMMAHYPNLSGGTFRGATIFAQGGATYEAATPPLPPTSFGNNFVTATGMQHMLAGHWLNFSLFHDQGSTINDVFVTIWVARLGS